MACDTSTRTSTIVLEAASVSWGLEEKSCITPIIGLTGGEYFTISTPSVKYAVWTSVNSIGTDPAVVGYTGVEVAVATAYTAADWITAFIAAIETEAAMHALASTDGLSVSVENIFVGAVLETITDVDTGFALAVDTVGLGGDLGKTKDAIEVTFEASVFDVTSNQTGEIKLDKIITGNNASLSLSLLEMTNARWETIVGNGYGDTNTPAGGTALVGFGTSKINDSVYNFSGKLILHPVRLEDDDYSRDLVFWKTAPLPESINFDGTDSQAMSVAFEALLDETKSEEINLYAFGDWTQDARV